MSPTEFSQGAVINKEGDPLAYLSIIAAGEVEASHHGHSLLLEKTDVIGLCDLLSVSHSCTYTAVSDVTVYQYPYDDFKTLDKLLRGNVDVSYLMVSSLCRQIPELLQYRLKLKNEADSAYEMILKLSVEYGSLCKLYALTPKVLHGLTEITQFSEPAPIESWLQDYYIELGDLDPAAHRRFFYGNAGISSGFLHRCAEDTLQVMRSVMLYQEYVSGISKILLSSDGHDLFSMICDLHVSSVHIKGADSTVEELIEPFIWLLSEMSGVDSAYFQDRLDIYGEGLNLKRESRKFRDAPASTDVKQNLLDSVDIILRYSECPDELCNEFAKSVKEYTNLSDRTGADDVAYELRKSLTRMFYELYQSIFLKSLEDPAVPTIIKMFLNFGYVDPILAGGENADYLYSIADSVKGDPDAGIYTISEWLASVYRGKNEPSLSEFDMDYPAYIKDLKKNQKLDDREVKRLLADQGGKLRFEMENVFPVVNRVTFGNPSRFCPLFADHNVLRRIEDIIVTPEKLKDILNEIRSIDFSAFYRETSYSNHKVGVPNENVNVEVLPNIVLMPNLGIRGSMWQEIEGRVRTTPARMFMPIFLENDLKPLVMRLTGEFRWEMCKRVQGARWNDVTDPSLTSLYSDYLQFYMNNRSISMPTMLDIRNELSSARNNFKMVFVSNYVVWLLNESTGSARLNAIAIGIMMTFCPFSAPIRERLANNLRYAEPLNKYRAKQTRRVQHLGRVIQKVRSMGKPAPQELLDELEYARR